MSFDVSLTCPVTKRTLQTEVPHQMKGGTYCVGGTTDMELNITYNYSKFYYETIDAEEGLRKLNGMTAAESIPLLKAAIEKLGDDTNPDYWASTEGNAKIPLTQLLAFAQMRPDGVWEIF